MDSEPLILIVDGEVGSANLLKMRLESIGYRVKTSSTGKEVFLNLVDVKPDIIVLNETLGDMTGRQVYDHLKEYPEWKNTQVIFVANNREIADAIDSEKFDVLIKPYDPKDLLLLIDEALEKKKQLQESPVEDDTSPSEDEAPQEKVAPSEETVDIESQEPKEQGSTSSDKSETSTTNSSHTTVSQVNLKEISIAPEVIEKVPSKFIWHYKFMPLEYQDDVMTIATSEDNNVTLRDDLRQYLGFTVKAITATEEDIDEAIKKYYGVGSDTVDQMNKDTDEEPVMGESINIDADSQEDIAKLAEDASVIKLVNQILIDANERGATDIHVEPYEGSLKLRYRVDGVLVDAKISKNMIYFLPAIISRIKIMSGLNIVERRLPQDGRANINIKDEKFDLRVSTIPTESGESIVIRVLPSKMIFSLEQLGLAEGDLKTFEDVIKKPHGVFFVTGPTGSGKTTTLYAALTKIKNENVGAKIITIEDPVEYKLEGITQVQVNPEIDFTFARGLRSFLRHDPDIMMVGEVRDLETAEISMRMALTGHLLFSTLHTNDASSGPARLMDIGIEPYLISSAVIAFMAQRLIRTICPNCKEEIEENQAEVLSELESLRGEISQVRDIRTEEDKKAKKNVEEMRHEDSSHWLRKGEKCYRGKGCDNCNFSGYRGRTSLFEMLVLSEPIKKLIVKKAASDEIRKEAIKGGMRTLYQHGFDQVVAGQTTFEEILRVVKEEEDI